MANIVLPDYAGQDHWKIRAVRATHQKGNTELHMVCLLLAVLGWQASFKPRYGRVARIDKDGLVFSNCVDGYGVHHNKTCLGPVQQITDSFRGLADHLKLDDKERVEMFEELKKWFVHDARADETNEQRGLNS